MDDVYISARKIDGEHVDVDLETLLVINVFDVCASENVRLNVVVLGDEDDGVGFRVRLKSSHYEVVERTALPTLATKCTWPVVVVGNTVVAGLCSVARQIIKSSRNQDVRYLLGFREACLVSCSESSIWTKFCEVDMVGTVKDVVKNTLRYDGDTVQLPVDLTRFEYHLEQPVRIHNVYKMARETTNNKDLKSSVPLKDLNIPHCYSEGPFLTLADVLLYPYIATMLQVFGAEIFESHLPLVYAWYKTMQLKNLSSFDFAPINCPRVSNEVKVVQANILHQSLYTSDRTRYNPHNRVYTRQNNIDAALTVVENSGIRIVGDEKPYGHNRSFDWKDVPRDADPQGGALPAKRVTRKRQQLENLAKAVLEVVGDKTATIVDFCSGSGHLGLLIAALLPKCTVILVENKEKSLIRAKERVSKMGLRNVTLLQCNLDYFRAKFDVGVSLHACGVATDLVLQSCIENRAHFVACPCCYGGIHDCYHLTYPRSQKFREYVRVEDYLNVAHAADQTHDAGNAKTQQGYRCMNVVDTDRKLYAEERGYDVRLGKLEPATCTPKNNLIVGVCRF